MKITSRNLNGIRAMMKKGLIEFIQTDQPDIICFQETKAFEHQIPAEFHEAMSEYDYCRHAGSRPGYAGTAIYRRRDIITDVVSCNTFVDNEMFYEDGRLTEINFTRNPLTQTPSDFVSSPETLSPSDSSLVKEQHGGMQELINSKEIYEGQKICLINGYFPNGGTRADGTEMLSYKLKFYDCLIEYIQYKRASGRQVIVVGDYNIVHTEIDIARPVENQNTIGFLPVERDKISQYLAEANMVDVFRHLHPDKLDEYTWWSMRAGSRPRNVGWRIDYVTVSPDLLPCITEFAHRQDVMGSDHCPVSVIIK